MGSDSKYKDDVSCGLVDFGYFSPNVCLGHCCPSRVKHISDHVSTEVVGWPALPDPERYTVSFMMETIPSQLGRKRVH